MTDEKPKLPTVIEREPEAQMLTVFGRNPQEVADGQKQLILWCACKIEAEKHLLADAEHNYDVAIKSKWRSEPWKRRITLSQKRLVYYRKIKSALEAGYWIIPPMDVQVFAIRTNRSAPLRKDSSYAHSSHEQRGLMLPEGDGRYVSNQPEVWHTDYGTDEKGNRLRNYWAKRYQDIDFPVTIVRPEIIDATQQAMARKVFDEIGILPHYTPRGGDPIIVGRIRRPGAPASDRTAGTTFFISWWLDFDAL